MHAGPLLRPWARARTVDPLVVLYLGAYAAICLWLAPFELVPDSWMTLVAGREVALNGLPSHEQLTVLAHGARWVDQQWLAQVAFYSLFRVGGLKLALVAVALSLTAAAALAVAAARAAGASPRSIILVASASTFVAPWTFQLRAQAFALPLFAALLWILAREGFEQSRRIWLTLPVLALWANLHGSVVFGACLVALYALTILRTRTRRAVGLLAAAPLCALASPYGIGLVGYYHRTLVDSPISRYSQEWHPTTWATSKPFFVVALAAVWLLARYGRFLPAFNQLAFVAVVVVSLTAVRNLVWFAVAAPALVSPALDRAWRPAPRPSQTPALGRRLGQLGVCLALASLAVVLTRSDSFFVRSWPTRAAASVADLARADASAQVFASDEYADWLLWRHPELAGRVAYDGRLELLSEAQLRTLATRRAAAAKRFTIVMVDRASDDAADEILAGTRGHVVDPDAVTAVVARRAPRPSASRARGTRTRAVCARRGRRPPSRARLRSGERLRGGPRRPGSGGRWSSSRS